MARGGTVQGRVRADVRQHGFHVVKVLPESEEPPFAYTIGLVETYGLPELVMFGLPLDTLHALLAAAVNRLDETNRKPRDRSSLAGVVAGYPVKLRRAKLRRAAEYCVQAEVYYGRPVEVFQVLWPDREGRFPDGKGFDRALARAQPKLY